MINYDTHFIEVVPEEYKTMFAFYVNQLQYRYVTGNLKQLNQYVKELNSKNETYRIIEGLKCDGHYILFMDDCIITSQENWSDEVKQNKCRGFPPPFA